MMSKTLAIFALPVLVLVTALSSLQPDAFAQQVALAGEWRGTYNINIGGDREIIFTLSGEGDSLTGVIDNPSSGIMAVSIESIRIRGNDITIRIPRVQAEYYGRIRDDLGADGNPIRIDGDWSQAGEYVPVTLHRIVP
jgi:hypothetical protein